MPNICNKIRHLNLTYPPFNVECQYILFIRVLQGRIARLVEGETPIFMILTVKIDSLRF